MARAPPAWRPPPPGGARPGSAGTASSGGGGSPAAGGRRGQQAAYDGDGDLSAYEDPLYTTDDFRLNCFKWVQLQRERGAREPTLGGSKKGGGGCARAVGQRAAT
jgi:hypothetical protein